ncbi:lipoyl(octanoyl) transferase LipB [Naumannella huperziae]
MAELVFPDLGVDRGELVDYLQAWELQRRTHAAVVAGEAPPTVLLLQHPSVYTAGKRTEPADLPFDGTPVIDVDRGGKITWHGPGQLVAYPIITLPDSVKVVDYVRRVEEAMIRTLADFGIVAGRVGGRSGAWLPGDGVRGERKIGQVGIRVSANTTMHGIALNVDPEMAYFANMIPCGIADAGVTSMAIELQHGVPMPEVARALRTHLSELLAFRSYTPAPDLAHPAPVTA